MWKGNNYLALRTDFEDGAAAKLIHSDLSDLSEAANKLAQHVIKLGASGFRVSILQLIASIAAIYLLMLDRTNWRTNILTPLLILYVFYGLPSWIFVVFRAEFGKWIALIAVILRLFLRRHFPDWLELLAALILLIVVAPSLFADTFRSNGVGVAICLIIACYLLVEHIRAYFGFRDSFTKAQGLSSTIGIIILFVYPIWN